MQLTDAVIAAIISAGIALVTSLVASWIGYRALRAEHLGKHRLDLINKQMAACEALWAVLEPASRSRGELRVIVYKDDKPYVVVPVAKALYTALTEVFNSSSGLYYSRHLREALFELRDFIGDEFIAKSQDGHSEIEIANNKAKSFHGRVANLRIAMRNEIGTEDLKVGKEGPAKGL